MRPVTTVYILSYCLGKNQDRVECIEDKTAAVCRKEFVEASFKVPVEMTEQTVYRAAEDDDDYVM